MSDSPYQGRYRETERRGFGEDSHGGDVYREDAGQVLQTLDQDMLAFRGCVQSIGTQFDSGDNRREIKRLRSVIKKKIGDTEGNLKAMHGRSRIGPQKIQFERLSKQLDSHVSTFQQLLQQEKTITQKHPSAPGGDTGEDAAPGEDQRGAPPSFGQQAQVHLSQVEQREQEHEELQELERDILDLHDIHQELAGMVEVQGEQITTIETEVTTAQDRVEHGNKSLGRAVLLKRSNRKILCCLIFCCSAIVIVIVILAIVLPIVLA